MRKLSEMHVERRKIQFHFQLNLRKLSSQRGSNSVLFLSNFFFYKMRKEKSSCGLSEEYERKCEGKQNHLA